MLIAFVAPKQFGKSTACSILKDHWGEEVVQVNFKDALVTELKQNFPDLLKEIAADYYSCTKEAVNKSDIDNLFQVKPPLLRTLMQNYGTEVRRKDNPEYWTLQWLKALPLHKHILVDDVRFINEAVMIKNTHGILIRLDRTDLISTDTHLSETEQQDIVCDYTITVGEGEFEELKRQLLTITDSLK